jgi:hypothetical protein
VAASASFRTMKLNRFISVFEPLISGSSSSTEGWEDRCSRREIELSSQGVDVGHADSTFK